MKMGTVPFSQAVELGPRNQVDVEDARGPEHHFGARSSAFRGVEPSGTVPFSGA
jgi:hypothetical protein